MISVIHRMPANKRERLAAIFYFYHGYFPHRPLRRLRWQAHPHLNGNAQRILSSINPHKEH